MNLSIAGSPPLLKWLLAVTWCSRHSPIGNASAETSLLWKTRALAVCHNPLLSPEPFPTVPVRDERYYTSECRRSVVHDDRLHHRVTPQIMIGFHFTSRASLFSKGHHYIIIPTISVFVFLTKITTLYFRSHNHLTETLSSTALACNGAHLREFFLIVDVDESRDHAAWALSGQRARERERERDAANWTGCTSCEFLLVLAQLDLTLEFRHMTIDGHHATGVVSISNVDSTRLKVRLFAAHAINAATSASLRGDVRGERSPAKSGLHVNFSEKGEVKERREKFLTAKYGSHQMSLIRKRLAVEMWLYDELQKLYDAPATLRHNIAVDNETKEDHGLSLTAVEWNLILANTYRETHELDFTSLRFWTMSRCIESTPNNAVTLKLYKKQRYTMPTSVDTPSVMADTNTATTISLQDHHPVSGPITPSSSTWLERA
ncbi:hypothetical protein B566_EDAN001320 [Ephemera danica]|nr:hypothetical protein B566_EDAN001320 [Ephemera danica]